MPLRPWYFPVTTIPVVVGIADRLDLTNAPKAVVGVYLFIGGQRSAPCRVPHDHRGLIGIVRDRKLVALASLVINLHGKLVTQLPLDAKVELVQVGAGEIDVEGEEGQSAYRRSSRTLAPEVRNQGHLLVEADAPREASGLGDVGDLARGEVIGRVPGHGRKHEALIVVISDPESATNHRRVISENRSGKAR